MEGRDWAKGNNSPVGATMLRTALCAVPRSITIKSITTTIALDACIPVPGLQALLTRLCYKRNEAHRVPCFRAFGLTAGEPPPLPPLASARSHHPPA